MSKYTVLQPAHLGDGEKGKLLPTPECWYCGMRLERDNDGHIYGSYIGANRYVCSSSCECREHLCHLLGLSRDAVERWKREALEKRKQGALNNRPTQHAYDKVCTARDEWYKKANEYRTTLTAITILLDEIGPQGKDLPVVDQVRELVRSRNSALENNMKLSSELDESNDKSNSIHEYYISAPDIKAEDISYFLRKSSDIINRKEKRPRCHIMITVGNSNDIVDSTPNDDDIANINGRFL